MRALPLHLGGLHPVETLLTGLLALGPFVILAVVVTVVSRRDRRAERIQEQAQEQAHNARPRGDAHSAPAAVESQATREEPGGRGENVARSTDTAAPQSVQQ